MTITTTDVVVASDGSEGVADKIRSKLKEFTPTENMIATFLLANLNLVAFETADSLSSKVSASPVAVGRFCRTIGFRNLRDLKEALRIEHEAPPWMAGSQLESHIGKIGQDDAQRLFQHEVSAIADIYRQRDTPLWSSVVNRLAKARRIYVAGFQTERGMAHTLGHHLHYVRADVFLVDEGAGSFADILLNATPDDMLVIIDVRRYSQDALSLTEKAHSAEIPVVVLTDKECGWAYLYTPEVLTVETNSGLFWISAGALASLINLLVNDVVGLIGIEVEQRLAKMSDLYRSFTGFVGLKAD